MLVDRKVGLVWAPNGQPSRVLRLTITRGKIVEAEVIAEPARLEKLGLASLQG